MLAAAVLAAEHEATFHQVRYDDQGMPMAVGRPFGHPFSPARYIQPKEADRLPLRCRRGGSLMLSLS